MKITYKFTEVQLDDIKKLFTNGYGERRIAKIMNISRGLVQSSYKLLKFKTSKDRKILTKAKDYSCGKKCTICNVLKSTKQFRIKNNKFYSMCLICEPKYNKKINALDKSKNKRREYRKNNKEKINSSILKKINKDPLFKLRRSVSHNIYLYIKKNGNSKNNSSILKFLPYSIQELKQHLESLFNPWMTWENHGTYKINEWNDNDQSTWRWQLDHIIPHSTFNYISMEDKAFKECWALENLRPLSAKQNAFDGGNKIRHSNNLELII